MPKVKESTDDQQLISHAIIRIFMNNIRNVSSKCHILHKISIKSLCIGSMFCSGVLISPQVFACDKPDVTGYSHVGFFNEDMARVKKNGKWGFINRSGKEVIPIQYESVNDFSKGFALVQKEITPAERLTRHGVDIGNGRKVLFSSLMSSSSNYEWIHINKKGEEVTHE